MSRFFHSLLPLLIALLLPGGVVLAQEELVETVESGMESFPDTRIRIACVGDNTTYGATIRRPELTYPARLQAALGPAYDVRNFGVNGANVTPGGIKPYAKSKELEELIGFSPELVIVMLGLNDARPSNWKDVKDFVQGYIDVIKTIREACESSPPRFVVCLPLPVFKERWGITQERMEQMILPSVQKAASTLNFKVLDLYSPFLQKPEFFPDGMHPDPDGAEAIARHVYTVLFAPRLAPPVTTEKAGAVVEEMEASGQEEEVVSEEVEEQAVSSEEAESDDGSESESPGIETGQ